MNDAELIPRDVRARLGTLRLLPRGAAGGDGVGQHGSRSRGAGLEFAQYRGYEPGDEPRRIDWKLYARSDRHFVREAERDSPLTAWIVLDASASMNQADGAHPGYAKLDAARQLAACTIEVALRQGDRFGLVAVSGADVRRVPTAAGPRQRDRCLVELGRLRGAGAWPEEAALRAALERVAPGELVLLVSDFFDAPIADLATRLARARRDVLTIQLISTEERAFPFRGGHRFRDPETGRERRVDAGAVRGDFLERFGAARERLARRFAALGIRHASHVLDEPVDGALRRVFAATATQVGNAQ
jgi:uncharacterized protein (DUF58 family)